MQNTFIKKNYYTIEQNGQLIIQIKTLYGQNCFYFYITPVC